jgi:hypothetical protein
VVLVMGVKAEKWKGGQTAEPGIRCKKKRALPFCTYDLIFRQGCVCSRHATLERYTNHCFSILACMHIYSTL